MCACVSLILIRVRMTKQQMTTFALRYGSTTTPVTPWYIPPPRSRTAWTIIRAAPWAPPRPPVLRSTPPAPPASLRRLMRRRWNSSSNDNAATPPPTERLQMWVTGRQDDGGHIYHACRWLVRTRSNFFYRSRSFCVTVFVVRKHSSEHAEPPMDYTRLGAHVIFVVKPSTPDVVLPTRDMVPLATPFPNAVGLFIKPSAGS